MTAPRTPRARECQASLASAQASPTSPVADALATIRAGLDALAHALPNGAPSPRWLTLDAAAAYVASTPRALADARRRGEFAAVPLGKGFVYDRVALDAWMEQRLTRATPTPSTSTPMPSLREHHRASGMR